MCFQFLVCFDGSPPAQRKHKDLIYPFIFVLMFQVHHLYQTENCTCGTNNSMTFVSCTFYISTVLMSRFLLRRQHIASIATFGILLQGGLQPVAREFNSRIGLQWSGILEVTLIPDFFGFYMRDASHEIHTFIEETTLGIAACSEILPCLRFRSLFTHD